MNAWVGKQIGFRLDGKHPTSNEKDDIVYREGVCVDGGQDFVGIKLTGEGDKIYSLDPDGNEDTRPAGSPIFSWESFKIPPGVVQSPTMFSAYRADRHKTFALVVILR